MRRYSLPEFSIVEPEIRSLRKYSLPDMSEYRKNNAAKQLLRIKSLSCSDLPTTNYTGLTIDTGLTTDTGLTANPVVAPESLTLTDLPMNRVIAFKCEKAWLCLSLAVAVTFVCTLRDVPPEISHLIEQVKLNSTEFDQLNLAKYRILCNQNKNTCRIISLQTVMAEWKNAKLEYAIVLQQPNSNNLFEDLFKATFPRQFSRFGHFEFVGVTDILSLNSSKFEQFFSLKQQIYNSHNENCNNKQTNCNKEQIDTNQL